MRSGNLKFSYEVPGNGLLNKAGRPGGQLNYKT